MMKKSICGLYVSEISIDQIIYSFRMFILILFMLATDLGGGTKWAVFVLSIRLISNFLMATFKNQQSQMFEA